jgi:hypothetical protein
MEKSSCPGFHAVAHSCFCFIPDAHSGVALRLRARLETNHLKERIRQEGERRPCAAVAALRAQVSHFAVCRRRNYAAAAAPETNQPAVVSLHRDDEKALCFHDAHSLNIA